MHARSLIARTLPGVSRSSIPHDWCRNAASSVGVCCWIEPSDFADAAPRLAPRSIQWRRLSEWSMSVPETPSS
jgi:hypothetical protein